MKEYQPSCLRHDSYTHDVVVRCINLCISVERIETGHLGLTREKHYAQTKNMSKGGLVEVTTCSSSSLPLDGRARADDPVELFGCEIRELMRDDSDSL